MALLSLMVSCSKDTETLDDAANLSANVVELTHKKEFADEILTRINEHRTSKGLNPVETHLLSQNEAVKHSQYMIAQSAISHDNFFDRSDYLKAHGAARVGENVAFGYHSAQELVDAWLASEGHRKTIEGNYTHTGVGVLESNGGQTYFTHIFIKL